MKQERKDLLLYLYEEAVKYEDLNNIHEIHTHNMEELKLDYQYLQLAGLITLEEVIDSEKWEVKLTSKGIDKADYLIRKKDYKTEEELFTESLDRLWGDINSEIVVDKEVLTDKFMSFLSQVKGFSHIKASAFQKFAEMLIRAYVEGEKKGELYSEMNTVKDGAELSNILAKRLAEVLDVTSKSSRDVANSLKGITKRLGSMDESI